MDKRKHRRKAISLEVKISILDRLANGEGSTAIGKHLHLGESTIRAIKKNESAIRNSVTSSTKSSAKLSSYSRDAILEKTESALVGWIEESRKRKISTSGHSIQQQARRIHEELKRSEPTTTGSHGEKEFTASKGWLTGFLRRNAIRDAKNACVNKMADTAKKMSGDTGKDKDGGLRRGRSSDGREDKQKNHVLDANAIREGLEICEKLENHFVARDGDSERAVKFQRELRNCTAEYREMHEKSVESTSRSSIVGRSKKSTFELRATRQRE